MSDETRVPRTYPAGVPCWIDLEVPDAAAVAPFYAALLGWTLTDAMPPEAPGHYLIATLDGQDVAAIASGAASIGQDPVWSTYVAVDDADSGAESVRRAGGIVVLEPEDNPGGRVAACADPQGAAFRLWQAGRRIGSQVVNQPGGWNFSKLRTEDPSGAIGFYAPVLGWEVEDMGTDAEAMIRVPGYGDHLAATADPGIRERQAGAPSGFADAVGGIQALGPGESPHWHVVFTVEDRAAAVRTVEEQGGSVDRTFETRWARLADVRDPAGAVFSISQFTAVG